MKKQFNNHRKSKRTTVFFVVIVFIFFVSVFHALGHGGMDHAEKSITSLAALKKATTLYDKLIKSQKIDQGWENSLIKVGIAKRHIAGKEEIVVSFQRENDSPDTLYIFFKSDGQYAGSNFTGK